IRDFHVTGVQTCALPIYLCDPVRARMYPGLRVEAVRSRTDATPERARARADARGRFIPSRLDAGAAGRHQTRARARARGKMNGEIGRAAWRERAGTEGSR